MSNCPSSNSNSIHSIVRACVARAGYANLYVNLGHRASTSAKHAFKTRALTCLRKVLTYGLVAPKATPQCLAKTPTDVAGGRAARPA